MSEQTIAAAVAAIDTIAAENRELRKQLAQAEAERSHAQADAYAAKAAAATGRKRSILSAMEQLIFF